MFQSSVKIPIGNWSKQRLKNLHQTDKVRDESKVGSGFGKNISNWVARDKVYPTNVFYRQSVTTKTIVLLFQKVYRHGLSNYLLR